MAVARAIFRIFNASLMPIKHEMYSGSYEFLYVLLVVNNNILLNEFTVQVLNSVAFIHNDIFPIQRIQASLISHAYFIGCDHNRVRCNIPLNRPHSTNLRTQLKTLLL